MDPRFSQAIAIVIILGSVALTSFPCFGQSQPLPRLPASEDSEEDFVEASPKRGWGEFKVIEEAANRPWWQQAFLWIPNRVADFIDIFRVDVGVGPSAGAVLRITEYGQLGYRQMMPGSLRIGDFGRRLPLVVEASNEFGAGPGFKNSKDREVCPGEVGAGLDLLLVGAYGGICFDELADFVAGIFMADFKDDDFQ